MPPYSDNLYSAHDSDDESLSGDLSPSDGYFANRGHPQDMMVEDPSISGSSTMAESKAQEARRESEANSQVAASPSMASPVMSTATPSQTSPPTTTAAYVPSSPIAHSSSSSPTSTRRSLDAYTEGSSLLHPVPPPAYSPSTSPTVSPLTTTFNRNYNTITSSQIEEGRVPRREPESMGGPPPEVVSNETTPLWRKRVKITRTRGCIKGCLLILLVLAIFISLLVTLIKAGLQPDGNIHLGKPKPEVPSPPESDPDMPDRPVDNHPGVPSSRNYCPSATIQKSNYPEYEFHTGRSLAVLQTHRDQGSSSGPYIQTSGKVIFRRQRESVLESKSTGTVTFNVWTTDKDLGAEVQLDPENTVIKAYTPYHQDGLPNSIQHCLSLEITVWLPWNATFEEVKIYTSQLSIEVYDDIHVHSSLLASFETASGAVRFPAIDPNDSTIHKPSGESKDAEAAQLFRRPERGFTSREIRIHTASGSVSGAYSLYDLLSISSLSGDIDISVAPQEADSSSKPAVLELDTKSGSINSRAPVYGNPVIPKRDYQTSVTTHSGKIEGSYYIGSDAKLVTSSSSINIVVLPGLTYGKARLYTESYSGSQDIEVLPLPNNYFEREHTPDKWIDIGNSDPYLVLPPSSHQAPPEDSNSQIGRVKSTITKLHSSHNSKSGSQKLLYPAEWEGMIEVETFTGSIKVGGEGVVTVSDGRGSMWLRRVLAEKGDSPDSKSGIQVQSYSGSTEVFVGPR